MDHNMKSRPGGHPGGQPGSHGHPGGHGHPGDHGHPGGHPSRFGQAYDGTPPWDIGRPQSAIVELEEAGKIKGTVLDAGCGTGENALYLAGRGHEVLGIDGVDRAIEKARQKAAERGVAAHFEVVDAVDLSNIGRTFDTVIDVGLFHSFDDEQRLLWTKSLATVLAPGGRYFVVTFSDRVQFSGGPRRIRKGEFADTFKVGFRVVSVDESHLDSNRAMREVPAWLATIERTHGEA